MPSFATHEWIDGLDGTKAECRTCRFWSDMIAQVNSGGAVIAACIAVNGKYQAKLMPADGYCDGFKADYHGKMDAPPDDGETARRLYVEFEGPDATEAAR